MLQKLVTTTSLPEDTYLQQDAEILEIFVEELKDIFDELHELLPKWLKEPQNQNYLKDVRRHFHTLQGSGRMVGANQAGEVAWGVEDTLNRVMAGSIELTELIQKFTIDCVELFETQLYPYFLKQEAFQVDLRPYIVAGQQIKEQKLDLAQLQELLVSNVPSISPETLEIYTEEVSEYLQDIQQFIQQDEPTSKQKDSLLRALHTLKGSSGMAQIDAIFNVSSQVECALKAHLQQAQQLTQAEENLLSQFTVSVAQYLQGLKQADSNLLSQSMNEFDHVWQQYSEMQPFEEVQSMHGAVCELVALNIDHLLDAEQDFVQKFKQNTSDYLDQLIHECELLSVHTKGSNLKDLHLFIEALKDSYAILKTDPIFFETADTQELFHEAHQALIHYFDLLATGQTAAIPQHAQHTVLALKNHISPPVLVDEKPTVIQQIQEDKQFVDQGQVLADKELIEIFLDEAEELLFNMDADLKRYTENTKDTQSLKNLMRHLHTLKGGANMVQATQIGLVSHTLESIYERIINEQLTITDELLTTIRLVQDQLSERIDIIRQVGVDFTSKSTLKVLEHVLGQQSIAQPKVSEIIQDSFLEESKELVELLKTVFVQWQDDRTNRSLLLKLQRYAHTLKGAAKMVEIQPIANVTEELEITFENFALHKVTTRTNDVLLLSLFDWLENVLVSKNYMHSQSYEEKLRAIDYFERALPLEEVEQEAVLTTFVQGDGTEPPSMLGEWEQADHQAQNSEMIRVSSSLIEKMVDLTGENSINRSRIEMGMSQFNNTLTEMELAIKRLSDQLRRMEGELETQIIAKHGVENTRYEDFDPLEMDQYSSLNQLSKSLAESASDLIDFKVTLTDKVRDAESLLLQQSRIQAEIQDHLMSVRLVPFSNVANRLERLARLTASTLEKPVALNIVNSKTELDRNVLERLTIPLEHMIRNAIDHGIESPDLRLQAGKAKEGQVQLDIYRQGADIVVTVKDDGRGIDVQKIEQKAQSLGLLTKNHGLLPQDVLQYIFHSGFTTAETVTQISGRGVGLDVVQNDIRALGGHISIDSNLGTGSCFTIRIPTTVAVHDALMVKIADQQLAIPLTQIERIVRVAPTRLEAYFKSDEELFSIHGHEYKLRYAGEFLGQHPQPRLNTTHSFPILLIKGYNNQTVALLVDQLVGSRAEIVVKPLGAQFEQMDVLGGATILGDGHVCLILDTQNMAKRIQNTSRRITQDIIPAVKERARHLVMIVDDSVTVRKVTSRLLERHGYDVVTAKDGIDAMEQIEHIKPDLMLLDIEMPRMDGFEVANQVRHDPIHKDLPIIMITSRTGEKHRERAFNLGVTHYMGKPFQEADLLQQVEHYIEKVGDE